LLCLAIDPQKDRLLAAVDIHSHKYAVAPGPGKDALIAANLPVCAAAPPVLLEPVKAVSLVAFRMLLPIGILARDRYQTSCTVPVRRQNPIRIQNEQDYSTQRQMAWPRAKPPEGSIRTIACFFPRRSAAQEPPADSSL
jgi:hypothetical protein